MQTRGLCHLNGNIHPPFHGGRSEGGKRRNMPILSHSASFFCVDPLFNDGSRILSPGNPPSAPKFFNAFKFWTCKFAAMMPLEDWAIFRLFQARMGRMQDREVQATPEDPWGPWARLGSSLVPIRSPWRCPLGPEGPFLSHRLEGHLYASIQTMAPCLSCISCR